MIVLLVSASLWIVQYKEPLNGLLLLHTVCLTVGSFALA